MELNELCNGVNNEGGCVQRNCCCSKSSRKHHCGCGCGNNNLALLIFLSYFCGGRRTFC